MVAPKEPIPNTSRAKVLLVEDHPIVRQGLEMLIDDEADLVVCGGAVSADEALAQVRTLKPDVVVVDIALGKDSGLDLIKQLHDYWPNLPVLALSMHEESLYAERALRAGAKGYVMKKEARDRVMLAIRRVLAGELFISEKMASRMVHKLIDRSKPTTDSPLEGLSDREFEVFNLIAQSAGPRDIAKRLGLSVKTVETHRDHIKQKLGLKSAVELTRFAAQWVLNPR